MPSDTPVPPKSARERAGGAPTQGTADPWPPARERGYHTSTAPEWTAERIAAAMLAWAQETGSVPLSYEWCPGSARQMGLIGRAPTKFELERHRWPGNTTVYRVFPSWPAALEAAGLRSVRRAKPQGTVAERVAHAREMAARGLSTQEIADHLGVAPTTAERYLAATSCSGCGNPVVGTGNRCARCAVREANPRRWTEPQLLAAAHAWKHETGRFPTGRDWVPGNAKWHAEAPRWPTIGAVHVTLGGFQELRLALDRLPYNAPWDRATAIAAINTFVAQHGRPPKKVEWESGAGALYPSAATLQRLFGGMTAAVRAAGHEPAGQRRLWDRSRIVAAIQGFEAEHGRSPRHSEWVTAAPDHPSSSTVVICFGTFRDAVIAARSA